MLVKVLRNGRKEIRVQHHKEAEQEGCVIMDTKLCVKATLVGVVLSMALTKMWPEETMIVLFIICAIVTAAIVGFVGLVVLGSILSFVFNFSLFIWDSTFGCLVKRPEY